MVILKSSIKKPQGTNQLKLLGLAQEDSAQSFTSPCFHPLSALCLQRWTTPPLPALCSSEGRASPWRLSGAWKGATFFVGVAGPPSAQTTLLTVLNTNSRCALLCPQKSPDKPFPQFLLAPLKPTCTRMTQVSRPSSPTLRFGLQAAKTPSPLFQSSPFHCAPRHSPHSVLTTPASLGTIQYATCLPGTVPVVPIHSSLECSLLPWPPRFHSCAQTLPLPIKPF